MLTGPLKSRTMRIIIDENNQELGEGRYSKQGLERRRMEKKESMMAMHN